MRFCSNENYKIIEKYIADNREDIIEDLIKLVRIPSVQGEARPDMPFGDGCDKMLRATAALYEKNGFPTVLKGDKGYTVSYFGEQDKKSIGLFSHGDVVPADGQWLICPPFEPKIFDGHIIGRGVNDDKSGIIEALYAAKLIRDLKLPLKSRLVIFTGVNEETGMKDIEAFVENEKMPDATLVLDGEYPCYMGEKSTVKFELESKTSFKNIKKFSGGRSNNIVLGEVEVELSYKEELLSQIEALCKNDSRFTLSADSNTIYIKALGRENHIIHIDDSLNAAALMSNMLCNIKELELSDRQILADISKLISKGHGEGFGIKTDTNDICCGNGIVNLSNSGNIRLNFDMRCSVDFDLEQIKEKITSRVAENWYYTEKRKSRGYEKTEDCPFVKLISDTYEAVSGKKKKGVKTAGGTHARALKNAFSIGTVGYYKAKPIDLPKGHGGVHQPDEKLNIDGFLEAIKILVCMIMEIDAYLNVG